MVMAFPFSNPKSKETEINTTSEKFKELYDLNNLEDIVLEMTFDSGLLNFFGSKSVIKIYNRTLEGNKNNINSKINIKTYAWGIRIKQLNYTVNEAFNNKGLLAHQKFTEADGSYFTIKYTRAPVRKTNPPKYNNTIKIPKPSKNIISILQQFHKLTFLLLLALLEKS